MYRKLFEKTGWYVILFFSGALTTRAQAQLLISGQLRDRAEYRDGTGTLLPLTSTPSIFISQRARLSLDYQSTHLRFHTSVQDVRVWGQDASSIDNADGTKFQVYEAWAELVLSNRKDSAFKKSFTNYLGIRIGRQELVYDDGRLLGNLDWLQQARHHDAAVLRWKPGAWQVDLGGAFNQNSDAWNYNGTYYTPANVLPYVKDSKGNLTTTPAGFIPLVNAAGLSSPTGSPAEVASPSTNGQYQDYKALQFLYVAHPIGEARLSYLLVADQFGKYSNDSVRNIVGTDTGYVYGKHFNHAGVNARYTTGLYLTAPFGSAWQLIAGAYYQGGKDRDGLTMQAYMTTLSLTYKPTAFSFTAGWDVLSGNNAYSTSTDNHRFDPLYGSPHGVHGAMDYFYAGTGSPTGGLSDAYFKIKYTATRLTTGLDYRYFSLAGSQKDTKGKSVDKYLGSELDWITSYNLAPSVNITLGLCTMAATPSMAYAKAITPGTARLNAYWSYLQVNITPDLFKK
ncbi:alginate export family protein [Dinghuibacter silviterrae]|uniref:Alginate export protein n=1 Tax=Dinghuibacter silviterrae TaxID=1539049 RepID=A0A4R8DUB5_9BACT|nr:alginate export family protein [Dinghuibacter silviterrae]TDX01007.1 alginate export protein [Dinghuibacter silviterrae]